MFNQKQTQLFQTPIKTKPQSANAFIKAGLKESVKCLSGNGALKQSSTNDAFVDQFGKVGSFKEQRTFDAIVRDCETLWGTDPLNAVKFIAYLRTISRKVNLLNGETTESAQLGAELKYEPIMRMIWLSQKAPEVFWKNISLFVSLGSWHDIFSMLQYDLVYNGWEGRMLDWNKFGDLILSGLKNETTSELIKKYLPQIRAKSACKTVDAQANCIIAKWICSLLFGKKETSQFYKNYRKLKSSGTAHEWQQLISRRKFDDVDFNKIHGRALSLLVRGKFLKNHNLTEKYAQWVGSPTTKVKYTGFVHELLTGFTTKHYYLSSAPKHEQDTVIKQFDTLVEKAKGSENQTTNYIVVRDTSPSMRNAATGTNQSCYDVAKALALYFSEFLTGQFANNWIEFNKSAKLHTWNGNNVLEKWYNDKTSCVGSTDFQSVFDLLVSIKQSGVPESDFPTGILCISDSEFDPTTLGTTNVDAARRKLRSAGFSDSFVENFRIVLWNLQSRYYGAGTGEKFETSAWEKGTSYFSGFSPSVISFLTGVPEETPRDIFDKAMNQEVLNLITV